MKALLAEQVIVGQSRIPENPVGGIEYPVRRGCLETSMRVTDTQ